MTKYLYVIRKNNEENGGQLRYVKVDNLLLLL